MGPLSYMRSVVDENVMWRIPAPRNMELWYSNIKRKTRAENGRNRRTITHYTTGVMQMKHKMATGYIQLYAQTATPGTA